MVQGFLKKYKSVFLVLLPLTVSMIPSGWGTDYIWHSPSGWWTTPTYWLPNGIPGPDDIAEFPNSAGNEPWISNASSVGGLIYDSGLMPGGPTFQTGQTLGPSGGQGFAVINNSGNVQTITMPNGTVQGDATGYSKTVFQFSGTSTYLADAGPDIYATLQIGSSTADSLTLIPSSPSPGLQGTFYGALTGGGTFIVGPGVGATFHVANTYAGGTVLNNSYLYTTANLLPTTGLGVTLNDGSQLYFTDNAAHLCNQDISANSDEQNQIYLIGSGTVTLNGNLTGGLGVNLAAAGSAPPIGTIVLGGVNTYSGPSSISVGGTLIGTSASISAASPISYLGGGGTLRFTDTSESSSWAGVITDNSEGGVPLLIEQAGTGNFNLASNLSGNMGIKATSGNVTLTGENDYSGGSQIGGGALIGTSASISAASSISYLGGGGTLRFTDTSESSSWAGVITDNSEGGVPLLIEQAGTGNFNLASNLSGNMGIKATSGNVTLTGENDYSGGSQIGGGALIGTSASISATSPISYLGGGGTLRFVDSSGGAPTWGGVITDNSSGGSPLTVEHSGTAILTLSQPLSGNMGVNVSNAAGTLVLEGAGGSTSYSGITTLVGNIEYNNVSYYLPGQITGGGALSASQGVIGLGSSQNNNTGPIAITNGSLFLYDKSGLGNASALSLTSSVFGLFSLPLSGENQIVRPPAISLTGSNTFALGINATNSTIMDLTNNQSLSLSDVNLQVITSPSVLYGPSQEFTLFSNTGGQTAFNQVTLLGLDAFTGALDTSTPNTIKYIVQKKSDGNVQVAAHTSIVTGHTAFKTGQIVTSTLNSQRQVMRNEGGAFTGFRSFQGNPIKAPEVDVSYLTLTDGGLDRAVEENMKCWNPLGRKKTSLWAQPFGVVLDQGTVDGVPGFSSRTGGILFGMDHKVNPGLLVGGGLGYAYTKMSIDQNLGKSRVKDKFGTVFASFFGDEWHVDLAVVAGLQHHRGYRTVQGTNLQVESQHNGYQVMPHIGGGYTFGMNDCYQIHTFAQLDYVYSHENRYQENGANILNYFIEAHESRMLRSEVGFHVAQICDLETAQWLRSVKLSLINKAPLKKGPILSSYGDSAQSTNLNTTFISPGVKSALQYADGFSVGFNYNAEISLAHKTTSQELMLQAGKKF